jgi:hypothetical protein
MKQGQSGRSVTETKVEPRSRAVNPGGVGQIGIAQGNHVMEKGKVSGGLERMYEGRGYKAPMAGTSSHHSGSQGKHR